MNVNARMRVVAGKFPSISQYSCVMDAYAPFTHTHTHTYTHSYNNPNRAHMASA